MRKEAAMSENIRTLSPQDTRLKALLNELLDTQALGMYAAKLDDITTEILDTGIIDDKREALAYVRAFHRLARLLRSLRHELESKGKEGKPCI